MEGSNHLPKIEVYSILITWEDMYYKVSTNTGMANTNPLHVGEIQG